MQPIQMVLEDREEQKMLKYYISEEAEEDVASQAHPPFVWTRHFVSVSL